MAGKCSARWVNPLRRLPPFSGQRSADPKLKVSKFQSIFSIFFFFSWPICCWQTSRERTAAVSSWASGRANQQQNQTISRFEKSETDWKNEWFILELFTSFADHLDNWLHKKWIKKKERENLVHGKHFKINKEIKKKKKCRRVLLASFIKTLKIVHFQIEKQNTGRAYKITKIFTDINYNPVYWIT